MNNFVMIDSYEVFLFLGAATYMVFGFYFTFRLKDRVERKKFMFKLSIIEGYKSGLINSIDDIINLYKGTVGGESEDFKQGLNKFLRDFLVLLMANKFDIDDNLKLDIKNKITGFIKENENKFPFSELPSHERNILNDLEEYIKENNKKGLERKVDELKNVILVRYEGFKKLEVLNKWSIPLAVVGLLLTIIFGIISII